MTKKLNLFVIYVLSVAHDMQAMDADKVKLELASNPCALHQACEKGDLAKVTTLLTAGASVNSKDNDGWAPLHYAAANGYKDIAALLINHHASVYELDDDGRTPLHHAASKGHEEIVKLLIQSKMSNMTLQELCLRSLIDNLRAHKEFLRSKLACIGYDLNLLMKSNTLSIVNAQDEEDDTPLHKAARNGFKEIVELLIQHKAQVNVRDKYGIPPLIRTTVTGAGTPTRFRQQQIAELLIASGASVNLQCNSGSTALHLAAYNGHNELVELLIAHKASVDIRDKKGRTPLDLAYYTKRLNKESQKLLMAATNNR